MSMQALQRAKELLGDTIQTTHGYRGDETLVVRD